MKALRVNELLPDLAGVALEERGDTQPASGRGVGQNPRRHARLSRFINDPWRLSIKTARALLRRAWRGRRNCRIGRRCRGMGAVGDKVVCGGLGTFAEYIVMPADTVAQNTRQS